MSGWDFEGVYRRGAIEEGPGGGFGRGGVREVRIEEALCDYGSRPGYTSNALELPGRMSRTKEVRGKMVSPITQLW